jgi:hypothetical protein
MTEVELQIPFGQACELAEEIFGTKSLYYLHSQAGSRDWVVRQREGRVFLRIRDPRMATFFLLQT